MSAMQQWLRGQIERPDLDDRARRDISCDRYQVTHYTRHADGFTAVTALELEALRLAYDWRHGAGLVVEPAPNVGGWAVRVYQGGMA